MENSRRQSLRDLVFVGMAALAMLEANRFGSRHPQNLGVGLGMMIIAAWQVARGRASLLFRSVKREDNPTLFWVSIFFTAIIGVLGVRLSYY